MPKITRIHVKNFRSIRECTFELKDLQLLIGPNNSGKTNLLRVFEFLRQVNDDNSLKNIDIDKIKFQHKAVHDHMKAEQPLPDPIEITVEVADSAYYYYKVELHLIYRNTYYSPSDAIFSVFIGIRDSALSDNAFLGLDLSNINKLCKSFVTSVLARNNNKPLLPHAISPEIKVEDPYNIGQAFNYVLSLHPGKVTVIRRDQSLGTFLSYRENIAEPLNSIKNKINGLFKQLIIYKPDTYYIKLPVSEFSKQEIINGQGSNIVAYLEGLLSSDPERFLKINEELHNCIPDFKGYNFATVEKPEADGSTKANVRLLRLKDRFGVDHFAEDISEGTLYFLMLFAIINQKNLPPVLMLEEPETGIHPRRIAEIMEYIFKLREQYPELSIILTTHHPYVVDHFKDLTDRVWIFDSKDGETKIRNLDRDIIEPSNEKLQEAKEDPIDYSSSLGEHWAMGFLGGVPEPVHR